MIDGIKQKMASQIILRDADDIKNQSEVIHEKKLEPYNLDNEHKAICDIRFVIC